MTCGHPWAIFKITTKLHSPALVCVPLQNTYTRSFYAHRIFYTVHRHENVKSDQFHLIFVMTDSAL